MKIFLYSFFFLIINISFLFQNARPAGAEGLRAGVAKLKITPKVETFKDGNENLRYDEGEYFEDLNGNRIWDPVWLAGFQKSRLAIGVHDDLWVRALAVSDSEKTILLIALDLIGFLFDDVEKTKYQIAEVSGVPAENIIIASTHDHSAPDTIGLWGDRGRTGKDPIYIRQVREKIVRCAQEAVNGQKSAKFSFGKVDYEKPIEDSRKPKVKNGWLLSMRAVDEQGKTIATLVNYAMHPEVLNGKNFEVTSDYPGVLRDILEKQYGGTSIFFTGDVGGMQHPYVMIHNFWSSKKVGKSLADKVIQSLTDDETDQAKEPKSISFIEIATGKITLPIDNPRFLNAINSGLFGDSNKFIKKEGDRVFIPSDIAYIKIGPAAFLTLPGEFFPELGIELKKEMSAEYPFLLGLANNEIGYVVPTDQWDDRGYEETMSLGRRTAELLIPSLKDLISQIKTIPATAGAPKEVQE